MFYEEAVIKSLLKCQQCNKTYNDYDQPKTLPCGKNVCSNCTLKIESHLASNKFKCNVCFDHHSYPENGFPENETLSELIKAKPKEIYRSKECEELKSNLKIIESLVNKLSFDCENGIDKIKDHCAEQRRLVQLTTEKKLQQINNLNESFIKEIDDYERDCIQFYLSNEDNLIKNTNEIISKANSLIAEKSGYLREVQIDEEEIKASNRITRGLKSDLEQELNYVKSLIFNSCLIKFNSNADSMVDESILGNFAYDRLESYPIKLISGSLDGTIRLWNLHSGECVRTFEGHDDQVITIRAVGQKLISGSADTLIKIWSLETGDCIKTIYAHTARVRCIQIISDERFVSSSDDKTIKLWDLNTGECIRTLIGHLSEIYCIDVLSNDEIISGSNDTTIKKWNINNGDCLKTIEGNSSFVWSIKVLSSENVLAGLSNGDIKMWDLNSGTCLKTFTGHTGGVLCLQKFSDDKIATCSSDKTIKIWNYLGECLKTIDAHSGRVWSIDILTGNKILSSLENATIKLWNIDSGECLKTFNGHASHVWCLEILRSTTKD